MAAIIKYQQEFPLWHNGFGCILEAIRHRFIPSLAQWVKEPALPELWLRSQLGLDLIPGSETPYAVGLPKKKKREKESGILKYKAERKRNCVVIPWEPWRSTEKLFCPPSSSPWCQKLYPHHSGLSQCFSASPGELMKPSRL